MHVISFLSLFFVQITAVKNRLHFKFVVNRYTPLINSFIVRLQKLCFRKSYTNTTLHNAYYTYTCARKSSSIRMTQRAKTNYYNADNFLFLMIDHAHKYFANTLSYTSSLLCLTIYIHPPEFRNPRS